MESPEREGILKETLAKCEAEGYRIIKINRKVDAIGIKDGKVIAITVFTKTRSRRASTNHGNFVTKLAGGIVLSRLKTIFGDFDDFRWGLIFHDRT